MTRILSFLADLEKRPGARKYGREEYNLEGYRAWLDAHGVPRNGTPWIHVAGTKGKGSTCATVEALLRAAGLRTGLYTSPHLDHYGQRFRIDGRAWTSEEFESAVARVEPFATPDRTVFEVLTAIAFREFAAARVHVGILETGLGGRLDCTNVVDAPVACAIASIGIDHREQLGPTHESIASEKAGIAKPGRPLVVFDATDDASERARRVIVEHAHSVGAPIVEPAPVRIERVDGDGLLLHARGETFKWPLRGEFQAANFAIALRLAEIFMEETGVPRERLSLARAAGLVDWPGRLELLAGAPTLVLDAAHCPMSARALGHALADEPFASAAPFTLLWGMQSDKDHAGFVARLLEAAPRGTIARVVCYRVPGARGAEAEALATAARAAGAETITATDPENAWRAATSFGDAVLACGTLYTLGVFRKLHEANAKN